MLVAEGLDAHVAETNGALRGGEGEDAAAGRMELGGGNHLSEVFHVRGLHVHDVCDARAQCNATPIPALVKPAERDAHERMNDEREYR